MSDELNDVLAKFVASKKQPAEVPQISLAEKLRLKADSVRQAQGVTERPTVNAIEDKEYLSRCLYTGSISPFKCDAVITTDAGIQHEMKFSFESGRCLIDSQLFPSPSYIVETVPEPKPKDFTVTVSEFFDIARIIKVFGAIKVTAENKAVKPTAK